MPPVGADGLVFASSSRSPRPRAVVSCGFGSAAGVACGMRTGALDSVSATTSLFNGDAGVAAVAVFEVESAGAFAVEDVFAAAYGFIGTDEFAAFAAVFEF